MLLTAGTVLTGSELLRPGWIEVDDGVVTAVGAGTPPRPADRDLGAVTVVLVLLMAWRLAGPRTTVFAGAALAWAVARALRLGRAAQPYQPYG